MKLSVKKLFSFLALAAMVVPSVALAQATNADLENQVKELTKKVAALESSKGSAAYVMPTEGGEKTGGLLHAAQDIDVTGYVATTYTDHIDQKQNYQGDVYDGYQGFALNQADIAFQKKAAADGGAGFKVDFLAGTDNIVMQHPLTGATATPATSGIKNNNSRVDYNEAYVEVNAPTTIKNDVLPSVVNIKAGRMVTLAGREVIRPQDNWNISRSVAFGYGLPYRHTGVRTESQWFNGKLDFYLGLNNGWDNDTAINGGRTLETAAGFSPIENVKYFTTILWGPQNLDRTGHRTFLWTHVIDWSVTKNLSLGGDIDWGHTNHVSADMGNDNWLELAGYARYAFNDKWSGAYRQEFFHDASQVRGALADPATGPGAGGNGEIWANTFTVEYKMYENLITRLEYRLDKANSKNGVVFGGDSTRNTLSAQMIYSL